MSVVTCELNRVMYETHCTKGWKMVNVASEYWNNNDFFLFVQSCQTHGVQSWGSMYYVLSY